MATLGIIRLKFQTSFPVCKDQLSREEGDLDAQWVEFPESVALGQAHLGQKWHRKSEMQQLCSIEL